MNEKLKVLGQAVRAVVGGHMTTVFLIGYDASDDTYNGMACVDGTIRVNVVGGTEGIATSIGAQQFGAGQWLLVPTLRVQGLRQYPYKERSNADFQFVSPGEDEQPLLDIASGNVPPPPGTEEIVDVSEQAEGNEKTSLTPEEQKKLDKQKRKGR